MHFHILAQKIPWTEELGGLQSTGLQRVGHNSAHTYTHRLEARTQVFVLLPASDLPGFLHEIQGIWQNCA